MTQLLLAHRRSCHCQASSAAHPDALCGDQRPHQGSPAADRPRPRLSAGVDNDGATPLFNAVREKNIELAERGADAAKADHCTPLRFASSKGDLAAAQLLLAFGANRALENSHRESAAEIAAIVGHHASIDFYAAVQDIDMAKPSKSPLPARSTLLVRPRSKLAASTPLGALSLSSGRCCRAPRTCSGLALRPGAC